MEHRISIAEYGATPGTRPHGAGLREQILAATDEETRVVVDFEGVLNASGSFIDELLGKLAVEVNGSGAPRDVTVENANEQIEAVIDRVLERRRMISQHGPTAIPL